MFEVFNQIKNAHKDIKIIVGIDANSFVSSSEYPFISDNVYTIYPSTKNNFTTAKKRTAMQLQTHKSNLVDIKCKDHIITT